jgi:hypothetical protein
MSPRTPREDDVGRLQPPCRSRRVRSEAGPFKTALRRSLLGASPLAYAELVRAVALKLGVAVMNGVSRSVAPTREPRIKP